MTSLDPPLPLEPRRALPSQLLPLDPRLAFPVDDPRRTKSNHEQAKHPIMTHEQPKFQTPAVRLDYLIQVKIIILHFLANFINDLFRRRKI